MPLALRTTRFWCYRHAKTWRGTLTISFIYPTFYLTAIGFGLGTFVDRHIGTDRIPLGGVSYLVFIAPGLLAASSMQISTNVSSWPVFDAFRWTHTYESQLATPPSAYNILCGHISYVVLWLALSSGVFLGIIASFGAVLSPEGVFALPAAVLVGLACSTPMFALTALLRTEVALYSVQRMIVVPLFLFSGVFTPISRMPLWLQVIAEIMPLYHGVALCRAATLGRLAQVVMLGHATYLLALAAFGLLAADRTFPRRIAP